MISIKKLPYCFLVVMISVIIFSCNNKIYKKKDLIGEWEGNDNGNTMKIIFGDGPKLKVEYLSMDSVNSFIITGNYDINFSKYPILFSIKKINELNDDLFSIIKFKNYNIIEISKFSKRWRLRPVSFERGNYISLNRVTNNFH